MTAPPRARIAVLDVDGTLVQGSLGMIFLAHLARTDERAVRALTEIRKLVVHGGSDEFRHDGRGEQAARLYGSAVAGMTLSEARAAFDSLRSSISTIPLLFAGRLVGMLRGHGLVPVLVSGSPDFLIGFLAEQLGIQLWTGIDYRVVDGRFTGEFTRIPGATVDKRAVVEQLPELIRPDWAHSLALSDNSADVGMLSGVQIPIAFEPGTDLRRVAVEKGWLISSGRTILDDLHRALSDSA